MPLLGLNRHVKLKGRAGGVARLYGSPDRREPLVALPLRPAGGGRGRGGAIPKRYPM